MTRALVGQLADTGYLGLECAAYSIQQILQRPIIGPLASGSARGMYPTQVGQVVLDCCCQFGVRGRHPVCCCRDRTEKQAGAGTALVCQSDESEA